VPADFPAGVIGIAVIALACMRAPLRTYLQPADPVFLLPMESSVRQDYIKPALRVSMIAGAARALAVYAVFVPLYTRAPVTLAQASGRSLWLLAGWFAAWGVWNVYGGWRERQMAHAAARLPLRTARYAATLGSTAALLLGPPLPAYGVSVGLMALLTLMWRLPQRHFVPWDKLIAEEGANRRRWYRFLGWFVDAPAVESRPAKRRWAAWIGDMLAWDRKWAWHYLYAKTFLRGETFGAWLRWHLVLGLILIAADGPAADWTAYAVGILVGGVQLSELARLRFDLAADTLPIPPERRKLAAAAVAWIAGTVATLLLWLLAALPRHQLMHPGIFAALLAGLLWNVWLMPRRILRKKDDEDDG
jgi:ABC-2 type transport system permease protein